MSKQNRQTRLAGWAAPFDLEADRVVEDGLMDEEWLAARVSECMAEER